MFKHQEVWLPDGEKHFPDWMSKNGEIVDGKGTYQIKKFREAMRWCKSFRTAVDVGAHVGLWAMQMHKRFALIHAFEPIAAHRECFRANLGADLPEGVLLYENALGATEGFVSLDVNPADSGGTHVVSGPGSIAIKRLDDFDFDLVDFLKIDCEGYEHLVLEGSVDMLVRCRPCVIVEQKPRKLQENFGIKGAPAVDALLGLGAKVRANLSGDYILSWD